MVMPTAQYVCVNNKPFNTVGKYFICHVLTLIAPAGVHKGHTFF